MFFENFMFLVTRNFVLWRRFNFRFIHERMFWEELDDYPEVIQSSFLTFTKTVRADCFLGVKFRVSKQGMFSSIISFSVERERECYKSKLRFRVRVLER